MQLKEILIIVVLIITLSFSWAAAVGFFKYIFIPLYNLFFKLIKSKHRIDEKDFFK